MPRTNMTRGASSPVSSAKAAIMDIARSLSWRYNLCVGHPKINFTVDSTQTLVQEIRTSFAIGIGLAKWDSCLDTKRQSVANVFRKEVLRDRVPRRQRTESHWGRSKDLGLVRAQSQNSSETVSCVYCRRIRYCEVSRSFRHLLQ